MALSKHNKLHQSPLRGWDANSLLDLSPMCKALELPMNKACPVILQWFNEGPAILCFRHPLAGNQIVKGTIEGGESLRDACIRELAEESGIIGSFVKEIGVWESGFEEQVWGFGLMSVNERLPKSWEHFTEDGGGQIFQFFWQPLNEELREVGHPVFESARAYIAKALTSCCT